MRYMRNAVWPLCAMVLLLPGCVPAGGRTPALPPAPATPGAVATGAWSHEGPDGPVLMDGEWLHLPAHEAGELLLWIEAAEAR